MIPVFYINLDRDTGRREFIESQFAQHRHLVRVPAIDGSRADDIAFSEFPAPSKLVTSTLGRCEAACALSHRRAWEMFLEEGSKWALIAEDDIHISSDFLQFLGTDEWIVPEADVIKAETTFLRCRVGSVVKQVSETRCLRRLESLHGGAGAYFINRESASELIRYTDACLDFADHILFNPKSAFFQKSRIFQLFPSPVVQDIFFKDQRPGLVKSNLVQERKDLRKKTTFTKIVCEISRPVSRLKRFLFESTTALLSGSKYLVVPYQANECASQRSIISKRYL